MLRIHVYIKDERLKALTRHFREKVPSCNASNAANLVHSNFKYSGYKRDCLMFVRNGFEFCMPQKHHMPSKIKVLIRWPFYIVYVPPCIISSIRRDPECLMVIVSEFSISIWPSSPLFHDLRIYIELLFISVRNIITKCTITSEANLGNIN